MRIEYDLKIIPELAFAVGVSVLVFVVSSFLGADDTTDWSLWLRSVLIGSARAAAGALLAALKGTATDG